MRQPKLFTTIRDYGWSLFRQDALAGLTVALVALPLSIAIAIASGATPAQGLVTAIIGGFVISLTSGSRVQIGGPTGAFIVVVYSVIADHGYDGLVLATMMAGAILLETALSYIGFGVQAPDVSLGSLISDYQDSFTVSPWLFYWPGVLIISIALCVNFIGDGLRDAFDPRQRRRITRRDLIKATFKKPSNEA